MRPRVALVVSLALVGSPLTIACAPDDDEVAVVRSDGWPTASSEPASEGSTEVEHPLTTAEIDRHRSAWREQGLADSSYMIAGACECDRAGTFRVTVAGHEVVDVERVRPDPEPHRQYRGQSIEEILAMFDEALFVREEENGTEIYVAAAFDIDSGHPTSFTVSWGASTTYHGVVSDLTRIDGGVSEEPDPTVVLSVGNEAFADPPAHITITADDQPVVDAAFEAISHNLVSYALDLAPGEHELRIIAASAAPLTRTIEVTKDGPLYVRVTYWPRDDTTGEEPFVTVDVSENPPLIM